MTPIANMNVYNDGMRKSMLDKIWFLDRYGEIIPVCVHMIQKLFKEIERLKCQIKEDD